MTVKELLNAYDNWNGITKINDCNLNCITKDVTSKIADNDELASKEVISFGFYDNEFCIRINEGEQSIDEYYVGKYVVFKEFGKTKITRKENYEAFIRNASKVMVFNGTTYEAVEYIKKYYGGNEQ